MGDVAALVDSGDLSLADGLSLLPKVASSPDRFVLASTFPLLHLADQIQSDETRYAHFLRATFGPRVHALGWKKKPGESKDDEVLCSALLWLVAKRDPEAIAQTHTLAFAWLADHRTLDADLVDVALAAGAKTNDTKLFDAILTAATKTDDHREKDQLYTALGAFTNPALAARADALLADHAINLHDTQGILNAQLRDHQTRDSAYFLQHQLRRPALAPA